VLTARVEREFEAMGYRVARNTPYRRRLHDRALRAAPARRTHALQIEINRGLYLDEATLTPHVRLRTAEKPTWTA